MIQKVYCVYDSKAELFHKPVFLKTHGEAMRMWIDVVNDPSSPISKHAEDYTLFELGEFDDEKGFFNNLQTPKSHGLALEFLKKGDQ